MKMEVNNGSVSEIKRSCLVSKSVKRLLNELQCVYGEKLRRLECDVKGSREENLRMKVRILRSYINDLRDQTRILVHAIEELEKEANEKVADSNAKLQTSEDGIDYLDHQKRLLEEDNKRLRIELQQLKPDKRSLTRLLQEAPHTHGPDAAGLMLRTQTLESIVDQSTHSTQIIQKPGDLMKAQVEDLQNQLKTKTRIIQHLEEEMKLLLSHRAQEKNEGKRVAEALKEVCKEEVCKPSMESKRTHTEQIHKMESKVTKRLHEVKRQLGELKKECDQKQKEIEKLREDITKHDAVVKENTEELQKIISEKRNLELEVTIITEKHRAAQQEVSTRDQMILQLRAELRVSLETNQGVQEELGLQKAEVSRLNEKVRKQQAHLQELREMCRHGNARMDHDHQQTHQLQSQLHLAQQQLKRQTEHAERLQTELTASQLDHAADAERWTQRNRLLHVEVQQLQEQNVQHTQILGELREKLRKAEHTRKLAQEKETDYEELLIKRDAEITLLTQQLEEIQDEVQKSRSSAQSQRSALDIFKHKYTSAMEKVRHLQVQIRRAEEEAELSHKQVVELRAEVCSLRGEKSDLESRYEQKARQVALSEEAMELLTDELQAALDNLMNREERNLHHTEEKEKIVRMERRQKQLEKDVAVVKAELQNTLLTLQTRTEELQALHEEMQRVTEEKDESVKKNQVMRNDLKDLDHQLQQVMSFFTDAADTGLEQDDSAVFFPSFLRKTEQQLSDDPEEKDDIHQLARLQSSVEKLSTEADTFLRCLRKAGEDAEMQRRLACEAERERDEAREQLQWLKQNLEETQTENSHLRQERQQLVTNINIWISKHKAANESLAKRIRRQNGLLNSICLDRAMSEDNKNTRTLPEKERRRRSLRREHQSLDPLGSPQSLRSGL